MARRVLDVLGVGPALTLGGWRAKAQGSLPQALDSSRGWWPMIRESFAGAWQRNAEPVKLETAVSNPVLFRCVSLIAGDVAKMRCRLTQYVPADGVWEETESASFSPVLRKPNGYQTRVQFFESWMISKLTQGNALVLKERDSRNVVVRLHVLDWTRVTVLLAPDGSVFYQCKRDDLAGIDDARAGVVIPASEVIHDRWNCMFHPLVGLSPIYACGLAALQAQEIQQNYTRFFRNGARPGGVLTAPNHIDDDVAARIKAFWDENFTGEKSGKVAVLGDGLKYEAMAANARDSLVVDQLKWSGATICGAYGVPPYMAGIGEPQLNNNVQTLNGLYYSQCVQIHIEGIEACLDDGLGVGYGVTTGSGQNSATYGVEFDLSDLLRMDTATQVETLTTAITKGLMKPDEGRRQVGLRRVKGGDQVYLQQQNYSLAALAKRDAREDPFATSGGGKDAAPAADQPAAAADGAGNDNVPAEAVGAAFAGEFDRDLEMALEAA